MQGQSERKTPALARTRMARQEQRLEESHTSKENYQSVDNQCCPVDPLPARSLSELANFTSDLPAEQHTSTTAATRPEAMVTAVGGLLPRSKARSQNPCGQMPNWQNERDCTLLLEVSTADRAEQRNDASTTRIDSNHGSAVDDG